MKTIYFILILVIVTSCHRSNTVTISGNISNPDYNTIILSIPEIQFRDTVPVQLVDGSFSFTIETDKPKNAVLIYGRDFLSLYLIPNSNLNISFDSKELKNGNLENITIKGKGSDASQFSLELRKSIFKDAPSNEVYDLPASKFDEIEKQYINKLNNQIDIFETHQPNLEEFIAIQRMEVKLLLWSHYSFYTKGLKNMNIDTIPILRKFEAFEDSIPIDNYEMFKKSGNYRFFVINQYSSKLNSKLNNEGLYYGNPEYTNKTIDLIKELDVPQIIKDELGFDMIRLFIGNDVFSTVELSQDKSDSILKILKTRYSEIITNKEYAQVFIDFLNEK